MEYKVTVKYRAGPTWSSSIDADSITEAHTKGIIRANVENGTHQIKSSKCEEMFTDDEFYAAEQADTAASLHQDSMMGNDE